MNHQYNNSKLAAAINGLTSSPHTNINQHHNPLHHQQYQQQQQRTQNIHSQQPQATTDAVIVQSNSSIVSDEFLMQLQEQFGGENKQIYILNNNQVLGANSSNSNSQINSSSEQQNNQVQYLIVDKDVDINVILQDPNVFNQTNLSNNQQQPQLQQQQYTSQNNNLVNSHELPSTQTQQQSHQAPHHAHHQQPSNKPTYLSKQNFNSSHPHNRYNQSNNNQVQSSHKNNSSSSGINSATSLIQNNNLINNQSNLVEESIQRVQVPPPKRKQFELKLENKRNSYQDVFLRFLAGEKQATLEIVSEHTSKKPKDNLYYSNGLNNNPNLNSSSANSTNSIVKFNNSSNNNGQVHSKISLTSSIVNNGVPQTTSSQNLNSLTTNTQATSLNGAGNTTATLDKENYYNSSRRENLLPLNNYEYRNSYKDHYDNQGVRVNPAVLKNLSYTSSVQVATSPQPINQINSSSNGIINQNGKISTSNVTAPILSENIEIGSSSNANQINKSVKSSVISTKLSTNEMNASTEQTNSNNNELNQLFGFANTMIDNNNANKNSIDNVSSIVDGLEDVLASDTNNNQQTNAESLNSHSKLNKKMNNLDDNQSKLLDPMNSIHENNKKDTEHNFENNLVDPEQNSQTHVQNAMNVNNENLMQLDVEEEVTFTSGEFVIHRSTFSGDYDNYDIWCVLDDGYLQKYEPVLLSSGERCHQSADVLAQYTPDKSEFLLVKVDEKGKTEQNNIVVGVLSEYEPKNRKIFTNQSIISSVNNVSTNLTSQISDETNKANDLTATSTLTNSTNQQALNVSSSSNSNVVIVTYDDLKTTLDVFLQVLLSQHLNGEFLLRIKEIQDEYFKPSIEFIDTILNEKYTLLINNFSHFMNLKKTDPNSNTQISYSLDDLFKYLFETKPKMVSHQASTNTPTKCQAVSTMNDITNDSSLIANYLVKFSGQNYNSDTLVPLNDLSENPTISEQMEKDGANKDFLVCAKTLQFAQLCHSVKHLKMNFYEICQQKIELVKSQINENSSGTAASDILNYCLADTQWLLEMFEKFKQLLFEVDSLLSDDNQGDPNNVQINELHETVVNTMPNIDNQQQMNEEVILVEEQEITVNASQVKSLPQNISEQSNGVGSVESNKLINDQISQIITNVEEINEMETS